MQTNIMMAPPAGSKIVQRGFSISPTCPRRPGSPTFSPPKSVDDNPISKALEEIGRIDAPLAETCDHIKHAKFLRAEEELAGAEKTAQERKEKLGESERPSEVSRVPKMKDGKSVEQEALEAQGDTESSDVRLKEGTKEELPAKGKYRVEQERIMAETFPKIFSEVDPEVTQANPFGCEKQQQQKSFEKSDEVPAHAQIKGKAAGKVKGRSRLERVLKDIDSRNTNTISGDDEEEEYSYEKQLKYILNKKRDADLDLASASQSLRAANTKFSEMHIEINHAVSKMQTLVRYLNLTSKERDELKHKLEELKKKYSVSVDLEPLRELIMRVHRLVEELSTLVMKCFEQNCHSVMLPIWTHVPDTFKERFIRSVLSQRMFFGFENENFLVNEGALPALDVDILRNESLKIFHELSNKTVDDLKVEDGGFNQFYSQKKSTVLKDLRKSMLVGNVDLGKVMHKDTVELFGILAREVWAMHKLALSMEGRVRILRVQKGAMFDKRWMKAMDCPGEDVREGGDQKKKSIQFMVMPGFQVGDSLVTPCIVYLM